MHQEDPCNEADALAVSHLPVHQAVSFQQVEQFQLTGT